MKNNKQLQKKALKNEVKVTDLGKVSSLTLGGKGNLVENFHNSSSRGTIHKS